MSIPILNNKLPTFSLIDKTTLHHDQIKPIITEFIVPKSPLEQQLETYDGLQSHIRLLKDFYIKGIELPIKYSLSTDVFLLPKILRLINNKYTDINLKLLELGATQLPDTIESLINQQTTTAKLIFGMSGLNETYNHFVMADYFLDKSAQPYKVSIILFDATTYDNDTINLWLKKAPYIQKLHTIANLSYKSIILDIQKSCTDCLSFSLELAKAAYKSPNEMLKLHHLNITNQINTNFDSQKELQTLEINRYTDQYIPEIMMKHCQSVKRLTSYLNVRKFFANKDQVAINKKQENLATRQKRFTKSKFNDKNSREITCSFSIEDQRINTLEKILKNWGDIQDS